MGTIDRVIRALDEDLLEQVKEEVWRQNGGKKWTKGGQTMGSVFNDMMRAWIANGGTPQCSTPQRILTGMLGEVIKRSQDNMRITGSPAVDPDEVDLIVRKHVARSGRVTPTTVKRYRQALVSGYLKEARERIDGAVFKSYTPLEGYH